MEKFKIHHRPPTNISPGAGRETRAGTLAEAIALTAEACGQALSPVAAGVLAGDLAGFDEGVILAALARCRMDLQGPLKIADILARIDDGRPGADEAWAMMPKSERASVVWTDEMAQAWGIALPLLDAGEIGGAHAAFREAYARAVQAARIRQAPVRWMPSLGSDVTSREPVLLDAVRQRRLSAAHVERLLPPGTASIEAQELVALVKFKSR